MNVEGRQVQLLETLVTLADTLVDEFDVIDVLQLLVERSVDLVDTSAAGMTLVTANDDLDVVASTSERSRIVSLMQLRAGEGPCVEAVRTREVVSVTSVDEIRQRWPLFAEAAAGSGYVSIHAIPMKLRANCIGSLNLFRVVEGPLNSFDAEVARTLADIATIGVLQARTIDHERLVTEQLQHALDSRVSIEQAKGVIAQLHGIDMDAAYVRLRNHARSNRIGLSAVAQQVADRALTI